MHFHFLSSELPYVVIHGELKCRATEIERYCYNLQSIVKNRNTDVTVAKQTTESYVQAS
jgi:hypothetical protein